MTGTRWPEVEDSLKSRGFFQVLCLAAAALLIVFFPRIDSPALQIAAIAGVGALCGVFVGGVLDVWFYVRPSEVRFEERDGEPSMVIGLVSQAAQVILGVCVAVVALGLAWQFGSEQMPLRRRAHWYGWYGQDHGPVAAVSLVAVGIGAFVLWTRVATWPGRRPELIVSARGIVELRTGTPFSVGWTAIREVRAERIPASSREPRSNRIVLQTRQGTEFHIEAVHVKPNAYDVFELLRMLHEVPELRSRLGRVSTVDELLRPLDRNESNLLTADELPFWQPDQRRPLIAGIVIGAIALPLAMLWARGTPLIADRSAEAERQVADRQQVDDSGGYGFSPELRRPDYDPSTTCSDIRAAKPLLGRLIGGLESVRPNSEVASQKAAPPPQDILNAASALDSFAKARLDSAAQMRWIALTDVLAQGAQVIWYVESSTDRPSDLWRLLPDAVPDLLAAARAARAAIVTECG